MDYRKIGMLAFLSVIPITVFAGESFYQRSMVRNFDRPGSGVVKIENPIGQLSVKTWGRDDIEIRYRFYADAGDYNESRNLVAKMNLEVEKGGEDLIVKAVLPLEKTAKVRFPYLGWRRSFDTAWEGRQVKISTYSGTKIQAEIEISLPKGMSLFYNGIVSKAEIVNFEGDLDLTIEEGEMILASTFGKQSITIGNGIIRLNKPGGELAIATESGNIEGEAGDSAKVVFTTRSGNIDIEGEKHPLSMNVATQTGSFRYEGPSIPLMEVDSQSSNIEFRFRELAECSISVTSQSGDVYIQRDKPGFAKVELTSQSGKISHPAAEKNATHIEIENPDGFGTVVVSTQSGDIKIK